MYASSDSIEIDVIGVGGHGSAPHDADRPHLHGGELYHVAAADRLAADRSTRAGRRVDRIDSRRDHS